MNEEMKEKEKMVKKFKLLKEWAMIVEGVLIVPIVIVLVMLIASGIQFIKNSDSILIIDALKEIVISKSILNDEDKENIYLDIENKDLRVDDVAEFVDNICDKQILLSKNYENKIFSIILEFTLIAIDYLMFVAIVDIIFKIFGEVVKEETPFTQKNIRNLKRINILVILLWIFGTKFISTGLMTVIIVSSIAYVFKYGYRLQQESNELL